MEKMKAISWDKLRRLVGRKKSKDRDTDSSRFQRSYSFKRGSVRKSGRKTTVVVAGGGGAAIGAAAAVANNGCSSSGASSSSSSNVNGNGYCAAASTTDLVSSSAAISSHQHDPFEKSNGQLSDGSSSITSNNNSVSKQQLTKAGYQEVTVNVDVVADGKKILKQEQVFELKPGNRQKESSADVKVAIPRQHQQILYNEQKYGPRSNLCNSNSSSNNISEKGSGNRQASRVAIPSSTDAVIDRFMSCPSPVSPFSAARSGKVRRNEDVLPEEGHRKMNAKRVLKIDNTGVERHHISEMDDDDDDDDEVVMNKWILMRNQGGNMGRRQRAENIYRLMSAGDDSEEELCEAVEEDIDDKVDSLRPLGTRNISRNDSRNRDGTPLLHSRSEAEGEVFEDEFYLAMLAESPRPLRRSTDSALSRFTSDSSHSRSRSRLDDNLDSRGMSTDERESSGASRSRSRLLHSSSALDLIQESIQPNHLSNNNSSGNNNNLRRRQMSPSAMVSPTPPPHHHPRLPSSCAQSSNPLSGSGSHINMIPGGGERKNNRFIRDSHKSSDDLVSDKHSPDSGSYHYGSSGKLSESKHGSGSSVSCSRDDLDIKEVSPSPDVHLPRSHHHHHLQPHHHHHHHMHPGHSADPHATSTEMLLSRQPPYSASSSANRTSGVDDNTSTPKSFWWTQKAGSTMTTSSCASKDSGFSLGRSWAWGLAHKVFGKRGAHGNKGPVLSVSKEGYFQRTNLRRVSGKRLAYPIHLRSSVTRRSSSRKRRSGRAARRANQAAAMAAPSAVSNSAGTSNSSSSTKINNRKISSSQSSPSSPDPVKLSSENFDEIIIDNDAQESVVVEVHRHHEDMDDEVIPRAGKLAIQASGAGRCASPSASTNYYHHHHHHLLNSGNNDGSSPHEDSIFEEESPVNIYQAHAVMGRRQRMILRHQQHQQFFVFATPHSAEPLIFVPPERRKSCSSAASCVAPSKRTQPVYSKTVFEIRNHCLPGAAAGVGPRMEEPVELLRLPRLKCDKTSCEKSILITKVSGPYDNDGRMSRASCASVASGSGGMISSSSSALALDRDCSSRLGYYNNCNKLGDYADRLLTSPCGNNQNNDNHNVGRRCSQISNHQSHPLLHHHQIKQECDTDNAPRQGAAELRRDCKIRDRLPSNSLNDEEDFEDDDEYVDDDETDEMNVSHHPRQMNPKLKNNVVIADDDDGAIVVMMRRRTRKRDFVDEHGEERDCVLPSNESNLSRYSPNIRNRSRGSSHNDINNAIRRKLSTRRTNNIHGRPSKVITKPTAVAVYRRYSTLYRRAKLGPNFALPRPTIKIGK